MKLQRHLKIIELIQDSVIRSQEELAERLRECGFKVTQATVSRDIKELSIAKVTTEDGTHKYAAMSQMERHINERYIRVFQESVVDIDHAQNIVVIKTLPGTALAVAAAFDSMHNIEAVGCIAGNDIILCVVKTEAKALTLIGKLKNIVSQ